MSLIFYYQLTLPSTSINIIPQGKDILQTATGNIYTDPDLTQKIGSFGFNVTILGALNKNDNNSFEVIGTNVYFLPQGTLSNSINTIFEKGDDGVFVVPSNKQNIYQILSGSGDFLNQSGFIVQNTKTLGFREMFVYFEKL